MVNRVIRKPIGPNRAGSALVYGWKLHVVSVVAGIWFPIAALLTPANVADSEPVPALLREVPAEVRFVLGDLHYNTPDLSQSGLMIYDQASVIWLAVRVQ